MNTSEEKELSSESPALLPPARKPRGFATMPRAQVIALGRQGGEAAHAAGTAHEFSSAEARVAGRKGGLARRNGRRTAQRRP